MALDKQLLVRLLNLSNQMSAVLSDALWKVNLGDGGAGDPAPPDPESGAEWSGVAATWSTGSTTWS